MTNALPGQGPDGTAVYEERWSATHNAVVFPLKYPKADVDDESAAAEIMELVAGVMRYVMEGRAGRCMPPDVFQAGMRVELYVCEDVMGRQTRDTLKRLIAFSAERGMTLAVVPVDRERIDDPTLMEEQA